MNEDFQERQQIKLDHINEFTNMKNDKEKEINEMKNHHAQEL